MVAKMRFLGLCCLMWVLSACGVVVEIATPAPTPTLAVGFANPTIWGGEVTRVQAYPRIAFSSADTPQIELFAQEQQSAYVLLNRTLYLPVYYNVTWFDAPQGTVQLTINAFRRENDTWSLIDSDSRTVTTVTSPTLIDDGIGVGIYADTVGEFEVKVEVSAVIRAQNGTSTTREISNKFSVIVLTAPEEVPTEADLRSPFGEIATNTLLYDFRGWYGGPCALVDLSNDDASHDAIVEACTAINSGDMPATLDWLEQASQRAEWGGFRAFLESFRGMIYMSLDDFDNATIAFSAAAEQAQHADLAFDLSLALHNLMTTYLLRGDRSSADIIQFRLKELRGQFYDEIGEKLTQANLGFVDNDYGLMDEAYYYFLDKGAPQANVIGFWLNK